MTNEEIDILVLNHFRKITLETKGKKLIDKFYAKSGIPEISMGELQLSLARLTRLGALCQPVSEVFWEVDEKRCKNIGL